MIPPPKKIFNSLEKRLPGFSPVFPAHSQKAKSYSWGATLGAYSFGNSISAQRQKRCTQFRGLNTRSPLSEAVSSRRRKTRRSRQEGGLRLPERGHSCQSLGLIGCRYRRQTPGMSQAASSPAGSSHFPVYGRQVLFSGPRAGFGEQTDEGGCPGQRRTTVGSGRWPGPTGSRGLLAHLEGTPHKLLCPY